MKLKNIFSQSTHPRPAAFIRSGSERKIHNRETGPAIVSRLPTIWPPAVNAFENNATECQACRFRMRSCPHVPFRTQDSRSRDSMVEQFWDTLDRLMLPVLALIAADAFGREGVLKSNASSCGERWPPRPRGSLPKPRKDPRSAVGSNLQQLKKRRCYFWMQFELYKQCAILVDRLNIIYT